MNFYIYIETHNIRSERKKGRTRKKRRKCFLRVAFGREARVL
jgi:hypothetical protein